MWLGMEEKIDILSIFINNPRGFYLCGVSMILGKQKTPDAIHNLNQNEIWIAPGVFFIFPG